MSTAARRTAAVTAIAVIGGLSGGCTPLPDTFWLTNATKHTLTLGTDLSLDPGTTAEVELPWDNCLEHPLHLVSEDGSLAALAGRAPICADDGVTVAEEDLTPATATATVVNTTDQEVDLSFVAGSELTAAPGQSVEVPLRVPAGECVTPAELVAGGAPPFWGGDLCDGEVKPLSLTGPPSITVDNRTDSDVTARDGAAVLGLVAAHSRGTVLLTSTDCLQDRVRVLDPRRARTAVLPPLVCPTDLVVVDRLVRTARATVTNTTDIEVDLTISGTTLGATRITLNPRASRPISLESPPDTCVLIAAESVPPAFDVWSGYLCDGASLTARDISSDGSTTRPAWEASW